MASVKKKLGKNEKRVIIIMIIAVIVAGLIAGVLAFINDYYKATTTAQKAILGNDKITVTEEETYYYFSPKEDGNHKGIIFYPGAKVDEVAYAPLLLELAECGYEVYLVKMPARMAILGVNRADEIIAAFPEIEEWLMAGHSLGGAMAANYSAKHDEKIDALLLLAAYSMADLTDKEIAVYSIYGSEDHVLNMDNYEKYYENLPNDVTELVIDGGNHAYFGYYGEQDGDGTADIDRDEQMNAVIDILME